MHSNEKDDAMQQLKVHILNRLLQADLDAEAVIGEIGSFVDCVVNATGVAKKSTMYYPGKVQWNTIGKLREVSHSFASRLIAVPTSSAAIVKES